jgi:hypothetical protein
MNISITLDQYNEDYVYFCDSIKNNIMDDSQFIRILYSTPIFVLNGIYISININHMTIEKYYNKFKCSFDVTLYKDMIERLRIIEENIIKKKNIKGKIPQFKIYDQFKNGNIKIFKENVENQSNIFLLKIAGIWETELYYGLTHKLIKV